MRIESVPIMGSRCFDPQPVVIPFSQGLTAIVGPNAFWKSADLRSLMRLFGVTRAQRTVVPSYFHVPTAAPVRPKTRILAIDVIR